LASLSCLPCTQFRYSCPRPVTSSWILFPVFPVHNSVIPVRVLPRRLGLSFLSSLYTIPLLHVRVLPHSLGLSFLSSLYTVTQLLPVRVLPHSLGLSFLSSLYMQLLSYLSLTCHFILTLLSSMHFTTFLNFFAAFSANSFSTFLFLSIFLSYDYVKEGNSHGIFPLKISAHGLTYIP
jgi:hypothetical protein